MLARSPSCVRKILTPELDLEITEMTVLTLLVLCQLQLSSGLGNAFRDVTSYKTSRFSTGTQSVDAIDIYIISYVLIKHMDYK